MKEENNLKPTSSEDFMLKEYDRIHQLWIDENLQAERRVNFFLTITSGTIGAIIVIFEIGNIEFYSSQVGLVGVLIVLFLFGLTLTFAFAVIFSGVSPVIKPKLLSCSGVSQVSFLSKGAIASCSIPVTSA